MGRRLAVHAGAHRNALTALAVLLSLATPVLAAPKSRAAKAQFARGVAAYRKDDYAGASAAFGKSFATEPDADTLFAWAQAERKLGNCDKASELYEKLLVSKLPAANKKAVRVQFEECKRIIAEEDAAAKATAERKAEDRARQDAADRAALADAARETAAREATANPVAREQPDVPPAHEHAGWYTDGLGDTLVILGLVGAGVGVAMLMQGSAADKDSKNPALTYDQFVALDDKAKSRGTIGVVSASVGGALIITGLIRYATRSTGDEKAITGWVAPSGGGLALTGSF